MKDKILKLCKEIFDRIESELSDKWSKTMLFDLLMAEHLAKLSDELNSNCPAEILKLLAIRTQALFNLVHHARTEGKSVFELDILDELATFIQKSQDEEKSQFEPEPEPKSGIPKVELPPMSKFPFKKKDESPW